MNKKAKKIWDQRIGSLFVFNKEGYKYPRWDLEPIVPIESRSSTLKKSSVDHWGFILYLGEDLFFSYGLNHKIRMMSDMFEWDGWLKSVDQE